MLLNVLAGKALHPLTVAARAVLNSARRPDRHRAARRARAPRRFERAARYAPARLAWEAGEGLLCHAYDPVAVNAAAQAVHNARVTARNLRRWQRCRPNRLLDDALRDLTNAANQKTHRAGTFGLTRPPQGALEPTGSQPAGPV